MMSFAYRTFSRGGSSGLEALAFFPCCGSASGASLPGFAFFGCFCSFLLTVFSTSLDNAPALLTGPRAASIGQNLVGDARVLFAVFANDRNVGNMNGSFFLDDSAFDVALGVGPRVSFDHLNAF